MLKVGVLVSGGGTNLQAILDAIDCGKITNAEVSLVISNNPKAYALERAKNHNIEAVCISPKQFENREEFHRALLAKLKESGVELIVLAGFLVAIPPMIVEAYPNKIINIVAAKNAEQRIEKEMAEEAALEAKWAAEDAAAAKEEN